MRDLYKVRITSETAESDFDREKFKGTQGQFDLAGNSILSKIFLSFNAHKRNMRIQIH